MALFSMLIVLLAVLLPFTEAHVSPKGMLWPGLMPLSYAGDPSTHFLQMAAYRLTRDV